MESTETLPATERTNLSNFIGNSFDGAEEHEFSAAIVTAVQNILGKEADKYLTVSAKDVKSSIFAVKDDDNPEKGTLSSTSAPVKLALFALYRKLSRPQSSA